jgi:hypothetical protein
MADQLPKSGTISYHTAWKDVGDAQTVADKRMQGAGSVMGATFNDKGSGPLHRGPATCYYTFFAVDGNGKTKGYCTFSDADGDRIFTDFTGTTTPDGKGTGINEIAGGTGKYAGIQGRGPWNCQYASANQSTCTQQLEYRLP